MACPAGRVVIHNFARRAILDALAPADRLLDVGCGGGLLLRYNSDDHRRTHRRIHDTLQSLDETLREHDAAVFAVTSENPPPALVSLAEVRAECRLGFRLSSLAEVHSAAAARTASTRSRA